MILLDTSVLIDHLRDAPGTGAALDAAVERGELVVASVLSAVELLQGMRTNERRRVGELLAALGWIDVSFDIAERAGEHARRFRRSHWSIGSVDYVIAATAEIHGAALWTTNIRHFPMFPKLTPPY